MFEVKNSRLTHSEVTNEVNRVSNQTRLKKILNYSHFPPCGNAPIFFNLKREVNFKITSSQALVHYNLVYMNDSS